VTANTLATVMDQLGTRLATITGLRVLDFTAAQAVPPFALVDVPESVEYDLTYQRGSDRATFRVIVGVGAQVDRAARDAIALYVAGSGAQSIKAAIEGGTVGQSARVVSAEIRPVTLGGTTYTGCVFDVDVVM
jgi:hypothetical protein